MVNIDHTHTKSAESTYRVFKLAGTFYADGPNGIVGSGDDFATVMQAALDDASEGDVLAVNQTGGEVWDVPQRMTITVPMSVIGIYCSVRLPDGADDHMFAWEINGDNGAFDPVRRPSKLVGFYADGNAEGKSADSSFLKVLREGSNTVITNNTLVNFRKGATSTQQVSASKT